MVKHCHRFAMQPPPSVTVHSRLGKTTAALASASDRRPCSAGNTAIEKHDVLCETVHVELNKVNVQRSARGDPLNRSGAGELFASFARREDPGSRNEERRGSNGSGIPTPGI